MENIECDGQRCTFMAVCVLKHGFQWDLLARVLTKKTVTLERVIKKCLMLS